MERKLARRTLQLNSVVEYVLSCISHAVDCCSYHCKISLLLPLKPLSFGLDSFLYCWPTLGELDGLLNRAGLEFFGPSHYGQSFFSNERHLELLKRFGSSNCLVSGTLLWFSTTFIKAAIALYEVVIELCPRHVSAASLLVLLALLVCRPWTYSWLGICLTLPWLALWSSHVVMALMTAYNGVGVMACKCPQSSNLPP